MENQTANNPQGQEQEANSLTANQAVAAPVKFRPYPCRARRWREVSAPVRRRGTVLFDQQMWCWGQDIRAAGPNILVDYGFSRFRPANNLEAGKHGNSAYLLDEAGKAKVVLWGFGMLYRPASANSAALFLNRYDFAPRLLVNDCRLEAEYLSTWTAKNKPKFVLPATAGDWEQVSNLLPALIGWIINYEQWVIANFGLDYRKRCVETWLRPVMPPLAALEEWNWLAEQCRHLGK